jgi:hypothetical protein
MSSGLLGAEMSVKSKVIGVLRSVFGIFVDAGVLTLQATGSLTSMVLKSSGSIIFRNGNDSTTFQVANDGTLSHTGYEFFATIAEGGASSIARKINKKTGIADNTATAVFTVTVPNANHAACIRVIALGSSGSTDAFESSAVLEGQIVVARTTGANAVVTAAAAALTGTATVAAGAALTSFAYGVSAVAGAAGASNTFDITVTINDSGNLGSNQCVMYLEAMNAESSGLTISSA